MVTRPCSITSWIAVRSMSDILSNSSMQTTPRSASTIAPASNLRSPVTYHNNNYNNNIIIMWSKNSERKPHHRPVTHCGCEWICPILTPSITIWGWLSVIAAYVVLFNFLKYFCLLFLTFLSLFDEQLHGSLDSHKPASQMESELVQLLLHCKSLYIRATNTDTMTTLCATSVATGCILCTVCMQCGLTTNNNYYYYYSNDDNDDKNNITMPPTPSPL